jgi:hypothetical protein
MLRRILHRETYCGTHYQHIGGDRIPMGVDPIIDRDTWEAAQLKLQENSHLSKRNTKYDYLMGKRLTCGRCNMHVFSTSPKSRGIQYFYYGCNSMNPHAAHPDCGMPYFPVHLVDNAVWEWIVELMNNPKALRASLKKAQQEVEKRNAEIYQRIALVDATWAKQPSPMSSLTASTGTRNVCADGLTMRILSPSARLWKPYRSMVQWCSKTRSKSYGCTGTATSSSCI